MIIFTTSVNGRNLMMMIVDLYSTLRRAPLLRYVPRTPGAL